MERDGRRGRPEILGRLRNEAEERLDAPEPPRWARPAGRFIVLGIVVVLLVVMVWANPL